MKSRKFAKALTLCLLSVLGACTPEVPVESTLRIGDVLGGDDTAGFLRATEQRDFVFPQDHGLHPGFRNEWWYLTGNVSTAAGRRFGYQVTFFAGAVRAPDAAVSLATQDSGWHSERIWMAHFALTDIDNDNHRAFERFSRENPGLAGAQLSPFKVWLEDWQLLGADSADTLPWTLQVAEDGLALRLQLQALKPPVLQGEQGLSQKSPAAGNASYYYSMTRLQTTGEVQVGNDVYAVSGNSWLDREWSTSALASDQSGWDWFSLQFDDGQELMYYQLRDGNGNAHPNSQGNWTDTAARQTLVSAAEIQLEPLRYWQSAQGVEYPVAWRLRYGGKVWRIEAAVAEQYMNLSFAYWEGAVVIRDEADGAELGRGYLEMVRQ